MAVLLRRLVACRITNDEFEDGVPTSDDPAIRAIHGAAWCLYEDLETHKLDGRYKVHEEGRREIASWVLFLHSEDEYMWPGYDTFRIYNWPMNLLTVGWWERRKSREFSEFQAAGEFDVWPFISRASFERALRRPR